MKKKLRLKYCIEKIIMNVVDIEEENIIIKKPVMAY